MYQSRYFFSVIVPSFNRLDEIRELVRSVEAQTFPEDAYEVLIVDDGSMDGTREWIETQSRSSSIHLRCLHQSHQGPGAARNLGMSHADGEYFVFIDSDCSAPSDWLSVIHAAIQKDSAIQGFGGRDDAREDFPPLLKAINYSMTSFLTTGGMRGGKKKRLAKFYPRSFNMGIHRDLFAQIGGFGLLRHGQDIEFSHRMIQSGAKIVYIPDSVVYHKRRTSLRKFYRQVFNWGVARINLFRIDSRMLEPLHAAPAGGFWLAVLFTLLAVIFPVFLPAWLVLAQLAIFLFIVSGVHAALRWKSPITGLLTPVVMILQISGYAIGFTTAFFWRVILGRGEWTGFVKRYYK